MTAMEQLFMQVFERRAWVEEQLRQQAESCSQSLASNLLAHGRRPPPWLWAPPGPPELNREELISGTLFPFPRATTPSVKQSSQFTVPAVRVDDVLQCNSYFADTCASDKYFANENRVKVASSNHPKDSESYSTMMVQSEAVQVHAELDPLARIQRSRSRQRDLEIRLGEKGKTMKHMAEENTTEEYRGRMTRSMTASLKPDHDKQLLELKNGVDTQVRYGARKLQCVHLPSKTAKTMSCIENDFQEEAKTQTSAAAENERILAARSPACNECSKEVAVASQLSDVSSLVQPKQLLFDSMECSLNDTSVVLQPTNGESAIVGLKEEQNFLLNEHVQKEYGLHEAETISEEGEADKSQVGTLVVEESQCNSHSSPLYLRASPLECISHPSALKHHSPLYDPSFRKAIQCVSENARTYRSSVNDCLTSKEVSLGSVMQNITKEHCIVEHTNVLINVVASDPRVNNILAEVKHPFDGLVNCDHSNALAAFLKKSHGKSSEVSFRKSDTLQSVNEETVRSGSFKAHISSASSQLQKEGTLNNAEKLQRGDEIERAPYGLEEDNPGLLEVEDSGYHSYPMLCEGKTLSMSSKYLADMKDANKKGSFGGIVQHLMEEPCSGKLLNVSTSAGIRDASENGIVQQALTPNSTETQNAPAEARYLLRSSARHMRDSSSFRLDCTSKTSCLKRSMKITDHTCEITWPKGKRMEGRSNNIFATSPRLRTKKLPHVQRGSDYTCERNLENTSEFVKELQPLQLSNHVATGISNAALEDHSEQGHRNKKRRMSGDDADFKGKNMELMIPLPIEDMHEVPIPEQAYGGFKNCLGITDSYLCSLEKHQSSEDRQDVLCAENTLECESLKNHGYKEEVIEEGVNCDRDLSLCGHDLVQSLQVDDNLAGSDDTMPEFEGFSIQFPCILENDAVFNDSDIPSLTKERASLLEQLCRSRGMLSPVSRPSAKYKIHNVPDVYQSLPGGMLEHKNLSSSLNDIDMKKHRARDDFKFTGLYGNSSLERPHSHSMPCSSFRSTLEVRKPPLTPPVGKLSQRIISGKGSSLEKVGSNPELICFRIDENSITTEENDHPYEFGGTSETKAGLVQLKVSANSKPLVDVTSLYQNAPTSTSALEKFVQRSSLDSVNTEFYSAAEMDVKNGYANKCNIDDKENTFSVSGNRARKVADSLSSRSSKLEAPGKGKERNRSQTVSGKGGKANNIISNILSFVPLVRPRQQAAAPFAAKRNIKVKALEAAEAAKRLEEKKQNEREMRKAAAKLERERLEQENMRQLELQRKQREETKKKKEADIAARKRQREEEDRREERKRRCIEGERKQQKEQGERLRAEKEVEQIRRRAADKEKKRKMLPKEIKLSEKGREFAGCKKAIEVEPGDKEIGRSTAEAHDAFKTSKDTEQVVVNSAELQNAIQDRMSVTKGTQDVESYEISPYKDSDDEDGEDDSRRKRKYIPPWARRESLDQLLHSMQNIDPTVIFSRKSSFNLTEVLCSRILRRPL